MPAGPRCTNLDFRGVSYHKITYGGRLSGFISYSSDCQLQLITNYLKPLGLFHNKEMLLKIASNVPSDKYKIKFADLISQKNSKAELKEPLKSSYKGKQKEYIYSLFKNHIKNRSDQENIRANFYLDMIKDLFEGVRETQFDHPLKKEQAELCLSRLAFIIEKAMAIHQKIKLFDTLMLHAFDEITFLKMLGNFYYNVDQIEEILKSFIKESYQLDENPDNVILAGSGMESISNAMFAALKEVVKIQDSKIYFQGQSYYELATLLELMFPWLDLRETWDSKDTVIYSVNKKCVLYHETEMVDLIVTSFEQNPCFTKNHFGSENVNAFICNQFKLRNEKKDNKRKLICNRSTNPVLV